MSRLKYPGAGNQDFNEMIDNQFQVQNLIIRLGSEQYEQALSQPGVRVFEMTGKPMKGWVTVGPAGYSTEADLSAWIQKGGEFARSLPVK